MYQRNYHSLRFVLSTHFYEILVTTHPKISTSNAPVSIAQTRVLLISVLIIAICGLVYELIISTLSSYLLGNTITHFSIIIGLFLSAMGLGSYASRWINHNELNAFVLVELGIGIVGGSSTALLYTIFSFSTTISVSYYYIAMFFIILFVGGCIGLEIPLLTRLVGGHRSLKDTLANVLAFDYVGALIGSILFPLLLLPLFGLLKTSFMVGLLNLAVVTMILWIFRRNLRNAWLLTSLTVISTAVLLGGTIWAEQLTSLLEKRLYRDEIVYAQQTPYQRIIITRWRNDTRLFLDGNIQFSSYDEYRYHEPLTHPALNLTRSRESILILGGGDGLVVRELLKYDDIERIVLVDIDPAMTDLARNHPLLLSINEGALASGKVEVVHEDAYQYLAESNDLFGVIIADLPDPNNESLSKLYSQEFYTLLKRHLAKGGILASQATSPYYVREAYWSIINTAESAGLKTYPYRFYIPSFGEWGFFLASEHQLNPEAFAPQVPLRYLTPALFQASFLFDIDTEEIEVDINTLDNQNLLQYYEAGWRQWR